MKAVLQCCTSGSVTVDGEVKGAIGRGYVVLVGITTQDTQAEARLLAEKCAGLRVFEDQNGKLNLSERPGELLRGVPCSCLPRKSPFARQAEARNTCGPSAAAHKK